MLKLYNKEHVAISALTNLKDYKIEYILSGEDLLEFSLSICDENIHLVEEEGYVRNKNNEYVIKAIDPTDNFKRFTCNVNIEGIVGKAIANFDTSNNKLDETIRLAIAGTGWILVDSGITKRRTVRLTNTNALEVLREIRKVFSVDFRYDAINKKIYVYEKFGEDKGVYFSDELNLKSLSIPSDTYDYVTRLYPYGKDGLTIAEINNGKEYIENFQYSNKIIELIWSDNRYTDVNSLKEDAEAKLEELSKPNRSYQTSVTDLAKQSEEYSYLDFFLGDTVTLLSKSEKFRDKQRIVKYTEYPDNPSENTCELGNTILTFEELQQENEYKNQTVNNITTGNGTVNGEAIDGISTEQIYDFEASVGKITDLTVINAEITNLKAQNVTITGKLTAIEGEFGTLKANVGVIDKLTVTHTAQINELEANKASITQLEAVSAKIGTVEAEVGKIQTLVNGNLTSDNIHSLILTSSKVTVENGFIKNAMIENVDVSKVNAGNISTNKFRIVSDSGKMLIADNTIQIKDNNRVRVQIGKDASNDYNMYVWDSSGKLMFDATGLKADGIKNKIIRDDMISDNANIDGGKINITSLITEVNKDTNTNTIKSTKIMLNNQNQTLEVAFNSLKTQADGTKSLTESHSTTIGVMQGQITGLISDTTIVEDGTSKKIKDAYTSLKATVNGISSKVSNVESSFNNLQIGGRNLILNSTLLKDSHKWYFSNSSNINRFVDGNFTGIKLNTNGGYAATTETKIKAGKTYTISYFRKNTSACNMWIGFYFSDNTYISSPGYINHICKDWKRYTHTFTIPDGKSSINLRIYSYTASVDLYIRNIKVCEGDSLIYDWSEAPEDVESSINAVDTKVTALDVTVKSTSSKVSVIEQNMESITQRVSSTETKVTTVTNTANTAKTQADKAVADAKTASDKATTAQNSANSANSKIDGLEIGGRNLFKGHKNGEEIRLNDYQNKGSFTQFTTHLTFNPADYINEKFTISFYAKSPNGTTSINVYNSNNNPRYFHFYTTLDSKLGNEWKYYSYTFVNTDRGSSYSISNKIEIYAPSQMGVLVKQIKVEKGSKPTDWSPAPEDTQSQIDANKTEISTTKSKVSTIETNLSGITQRVSTVEQNQTSVNGKVTSLETWKKSAEVKITDSAIVSTVTKSATYKNDLNGKVSSNSIISSINQTAEAIKINASKINLTGYVTMTNLNTPGQTVIDGGNLKSNSILAEKIAIGDFTNYVVLSPNSTFAGTSGTTEGYEVCSISGSEKYNNEHLTNKLYGINGGDKFRVKAMIKSDTVGSRLDITCCWRNSSGALVSSSTIYGTVSSANTWTEINDIITVPSRPSGASYVRFKINIQSEQSRRIYVERLNITRMYSGELIVDGSITAQKLSADCIDGRQIKGVTIVGGELRGSSNFFTSPDSNSVDGYAFRIYSTGELHSNNLILTSIGNNYSRLESNGIISCSKQVNAPAVITGGQSLYLGIRGVTPGSASNFNIELTQQADKNVYIRPGYNGQAIIGHPAYMWNKVYAVNGVSSSSDRTLKENIRYLSSSYNDKSLISEDITEDDLYNFIRDDLITAIFNFKNDDRKHIGFIAQDLLYNADGTDSKIGQLIVNKPESKESLDNGDGTYAGQSPLNYNEKIFANVIGGALRNAILRFENKFEELEKRINKIVT